MCSYHGMFPAKVAHYFIQRYSKPGDVVLDPFSGRGTTVLQARVEGRLAIGNDLNPLAYVLSSAKANPPEWEQVNVFVDALEDAFQARRIDLGGVSPDIEMLYHPNTLRQLCFIRDRLLSRRLTEWSPEEFMVAGSLAGIMHGASRRDGSSQYLSISMPNTFSMSPNYVSKYIADNQLEKPDQNVFDRLRDKLARIYLDSTLATAGATFNEDAAGLLTGGQVGTSTVDLIITSPPYLQVVNYGQANWIRLWLLGIEGAGRERGEGRRTLDSVLDHRHSFSSYCDFMLRTALGIQRALKKDGIAALVIGDVKQPGKEDAIPLAARVWDAIRDRTSLRLIELIEDDLPTHSKVSRIWGETRGQATNRDCILVLTHEDGDPELTDVEIDWAEPWKDGGPDAAHARVRSVRNFSVDSSD